MSFLIGDSGSSKADWIFQKGTTQITFQTPGFNPYFFTSTSLSKAIAKEVLPNLNGEIPGSIYFYGAGCAADDRKAIVRDAFRSVFQKSMTDIYDDLIGAARGLLQNKPGFICILGTGMNNGLYDGEKITHQIDSLGFILGDEGSGASIGKRILKAYLRNEFPPDLKSSFYSRYKWSRDDIIRSVYSESEANRFIAGFTRFAADHKSDSFVHAILRQSITEFFEEIVSKIPSYQQYSFNCIGSVGFHFSGLLKEITAQSGMQLGQILRSPMEGLVKFHSN